MGITVKVKGPSGNILGVNGERQIGVVVHPHPPKDESESAIPVREYFKNSSDSNNMAVNGATTNVIFCIDAVQNFDIHIKTISIIIADASQTLQEFANSGAALSNGVLLEWSSSDVGDVVIHDGLKTNFDFIRLALGEPSFGTGTAAFLASNSVPTNIEAYIPVIDFEKVFGIPYGLKLRKGTADKIKFTIRDDCTAADQFDAIGYGLKI